MEATKLAQHLASMRACTRWPAMQRPVVAGNPVLLPVLLIGQAPGAREGAAGRPFAWTAGKVLFEWFGRISVDEERFRQRVYMAAMCRCFPGKRPGGGDPAPARHEIENCATWLSQEFRLLQPELISRSASWRHSDYWTVTGSPTWLDAVIESSATHSRST